MIDPLFVAALVAAVVMYGAARLAATPAPPAVPARRKRPGLLPDNPPVRPISERDIAATINRDGAVSGVTVERWRPGVPLVWRWSFDWSYLHDDGDIEFHAFTVEGFVFGSAGRAYDIGNGYRDSFTLNGDDGR